MLDVKQCRTMTFITLVLFIIAGFLPVAAEGPGTENASAYQQILLNSPRDIEFVTVGDKIHPPSSQLDRGNLNQERLSGDDVSHGQIIHLTDYLYRVPEIREAYDSYLHMKEQNADELKSMMQSQEVFEVGDTRVFNVYNLDKSTGTNANYDQITFELRAIGIETEIWVQQDEYAPGKVNDDVVSEMMEYFEERTSILSVNPEQGIILNNIDIFAQGNASWVPDPDGSGVVKILICDIQDGWSSSDGGGYTAGFFNPSDLSPGGNSNQAAILYIDSYPGIYTDIQTANPSRPLSTVAHEYQHLIQARRGNLITFMDEGQSELAEILNGFSARSMFFLNNADEVSGNVEDNAGNGFLRWRQGQPEVLMDYQRAQLFHSYMFERVGRVPEIIGTLSQSLSGQPWTQYQRVLNQAAEGMEFREILAEFYVANWLNDVFIDGGIYGYTRPQLSSVRVTTPAQRFDGDDRPWISNERVDLRYGSANYTEWQNVRDLKIYLDSPEEVVHYIITYDNEDEAEVIRVDLSEMELTGLYKSVVLVSVNTVPSPTGNYGTRNFLYSAEWTPSGLQTVEINYAKAPLDGYLPLPFESINSETSTAFRGIAVRVDPEASGMLQNVEVLLSSDDEAIQGEGYLRTSITRSQLISGSGNDARYAPSEILASVDTDFDNLNPGSNNINFSDLALELDADTNYHVFFQVELESEEGELRFMLDQGSSNTGDDNYYPVRTMIASVDEDGSVEWFRLLGDSEEPQDNDNKNLFLTTRILSTVTLTNNFPGIVVSDDYELLPNYPNPFNAETNIRFNIPVTSDDTVPVRLDLYDVAGRHVASLVDGNLQAGVHTVTFDAINLASGVYITRLMAGDTVNAGKIMLLK